jgi:hypothetical protein
MPVWAWLVLGGAAWCVASVAVAVAIGRAAVRRERQKPAPPVPPQRCEALLPPPYVLEKLRQSIRNQPPAGPRKGGVS